MTEHEAPAESTSTRPTSPEATADRRPEAAAAPAASYEERVIVRPARTSLVAALGLVCATAALTLGLLALYSWVVVALAAAGIVLAVLGIVKSRVPGITGRGVGIGALVLGVAAFVLGLTNLLGITTPLNDEGAQQRLQQQLDHWSDQLGIHDSTGQ